MKCPSCDHQAPRADFGDPRRCPECGVFYHKALESPERKAVAAAGSSARSLAANVGSSGERIFFEMGGVKVTNARFIVTGQTYAMATVNSVKVAAKDVTPSNGVAVLMIGIAVFWLLMLVASESNYWIGYLMALALGAAGIWWASSIKRKTEYMIVLTTSSGETSALKSSIQSDIRVIEQALNDAIVSRG